MESKPTKTTGLARSAGVVSAATLISRILGLVREQVTAYLFGASDAVDAFKARAQLATEALGGKGYKVVSLNLNSSGYPRPYLRSAPMAMKAMGADEAAPAPDIEAGTSEVSMNADGLIEVQMP